MPRGLELLIAQTILQGFDAQYGRFLEVTSGAQQRFEQADWHAVQQAMKNRIHLYDHHVGLVVEQLRCITNGQSTDAAFLLRVKEHYTRLLPDYPRFEIAESFFNSVYCRLFDHRSLTPERLFIFSSQPERRFRTIPRPLAKDFFPDTGWEWLLTRVLSDLPLRLPWQNKHRDIHYIIEHLTETLGADVLPGCHLQVANELFYRNKAAWLVGKLITEAVPTRLRVEMFFAMLLAPLIIASAILYAISANQAWALLLVIPPIVFSNRLRRRLADHPSR